VSPDRPAPENAPLAEGFPGDLPQWEGLYPSAPAYQPRRWLPILLFLITLFTTTTLGAGWFLATRTDILYVPANQLGGQMSWLGPATIRQIWGDWSLLRWGLAFSLPTMLILLAHELGHYLACRRYRIPATWPHFIPVPIGLGTFGAFIRIKAAIRTKRELFDVGVAGPLAGFAMLLPVLLYGIARSTQVVVEAAEPMTTNTVLYLPGKSLLFMLFERLLHGPSAGTILDLHPFALAGWVGLLVTSLNLLPFGQLDGGHILYATLGRWQRKLALPMWGLLVLAGYFFWPGWFLWSILVMVMRLKHPPVRDERVPLDRTRRMVAVAALLILLLSLMPVPLDMIWVHG
jgi:membrane-associated protease RseP (regulator of RpoE activity)